MKTQLFILLLFLVPAVPRVFSEPSLPATQTPSDEVIAEVLGKKILAKEREELDGIIVRALLDEYAKEHSIKATEQEIGAFVQHMKTADAKSAARDAETKKTLEEELKAPGLGDEDHERIKGELEELNDRNAPEEAADSKEALAMQREIGIQLITKWKIDLHLYKKYGGRVAFQQAGPEPIDAYRDFLREQEKEGRFKISGKTDREDFWKYFTDSESHTFFEEAEGKDFIEKPWWLREDEEE